MSELTISIENVGGIDSVDCTLSDELNVVTGPNSSNKTSFLEAVAFGLGRSTVPIKNDADTARVELSLDGETIVRTATETGHGIEIDGDCWIDDGDDIELFEQFACLFEFSTVRSAVRNNENFEDVLKGPMDIDALEAEREGKIVEKTNCKRKSRPRRTSKRDWRTENGNSRRNAKPPSNSRRHSTSCGTNSGRSPTTRNSRSFRKRDRNSSPDDGIIARRSKITRTRSIVSPTRSRRSKPNSRRPVRPSRVRRRVTRGREGLDQGRSRRDHQPSRYPPISADRKPGDAIVAIHRRPRQQHGLTGDTVTCWACGTESTAEEFDETITQLTELIEADKDRRAEYEPRLEEINAQLDAIDEAHRRVDTSSRRNAPSKSNSKSGGIPRDQPRTDRGSRRRDRPRRGSDCPEGSRARERNE
ncbi:hypothetical protein D8S78_23415 [Natrialba swarupiae]|nr:hypothetical protein [Natrialba swarupiae]